MDPSDPCVVIVFLPKKSAKVPIHACFYSIFGRAVWAERKEERKVNTN
jgi:hypothetical protein